MKIILCIVTMLSCSLMLHAQLKKGQWIGGGSASFGYSSVNLDNINYTHRQSQTSFSVFPTVAYFVIDRLAVGIKPQVSYSRAKETAENKLPGYMYDLTAHARATGAGGAGFVRYYLLKPDRKINFFAEGSYAYGTIFSKSSTIQVSQTPGNPPSTSFMTSSGRFSTNNYSLMAGPAFFISPRVSFEVSAGYTLTKTVGQDQHTNNITLGTGFLVFFGK